MSAPSEEDRDRLALAFLADAAPGEWRIAPPCFTPNPLCLDQEKRGLIEIGSIDDRTRLRLTSLGRALFA